LALVDQLIAGGANFVTVLLLGRLGGTHELGVFALTMTVYYLVLGVQESLITTPYTIFGARLQGANHRQYSGAALCQSAVWAGCVCTILAALGLSLFLIGADGGLTRVVAAFALTSPLWLLREFGRRWLFAHMQLARVVTMSVAASATQLIALSFFAYTDQLSATTALYALAFGNGLAAFGWLWLCRREFHFRHALSSDFLRKNWLTGRWILASQVTSVLTASTMPWFIAFWLGPTATGIFAACESILRFTNPIIASITNLLTSEAAIAFSNGGKLAVRRLVWEANAILSLFQFAFCILLAIAGEQILKSSFGDAYANYWPILVVLGLNQLVARLQVAPGRALILVERAKTVLWAEMAGLATTLAAATLLIPRYAILGAALSVLVGNVSMTAWTVSAYFAVMRDGKGNREVSIGPSVSPSMSGGAE
jgi:O-antigen/teichoic acid export membrane protein